MARNFTAATNHGARPYRTRGRFLGLCPLAFFVVVWIAFFLASTTTAEAAATGSNAVLDEDDDNIDRRRLPHRRRHRRRRLRNVTPPGSSDREVRRASESVLASLALHPERFGLSRDDVRTVRTVDSVPSGGVAIFDNGSDRGSFDDGSADVGGKERGGLGGARREGGVGRGESGGGVGVRHVYLMQEVDGIPVANARLGTIVKTNVRPNTAAGRGVYHDDGNNNNNNNDDGGEDVRRRTNYVGGDEKKKKKSPFARAFAPHDVLHDDVTIVSSVAPKFPSFPSTRSSSRSPFSATTTTTTTTSLTRNVEQCINTREPALRADDAVRIAARSILGLGSDEARTLPLAPVKNATAGDATRRVVFAAAVDGLSRDDVPCHLAYWSIFTTADNTGAKNATTTNCDVRLTWEILVHPNSTHWLQLHVDASNGKTLQLTNWIRDATATYTAVPYPLQNPCKSCHSNKGNIDSGPSDGGFNPYDLIPLSLTSDEPSATFATVASPDGWLTVDSVSYEETQGNNARVAYGIDSSNQYYAMSGETAKMTDVANSVFNYTDQNLLSGDPADWREAAIVNAFYWCNIVHDVLYAYGFDEESGNFQEDNFGRGGVGGDGVIVNVQDPSGTNNAQMVITPEGTNPLMSLFLFDPATPEVVLRIDGTQYQAVVGVFGPQSFEISGAEVRNSNGIECSTKNDNKYDDAIVVIDRGNCTFVQKVKSAQDRGAAAVIIVNNVEGNPLKMSGEDDSISIPSVFVTLEDGTDLQKSLPTDDSLLSTPDFSGQAMLDSAFDSDIIVHEYCHGMSSRLTGGASNSFCLDVESRLENASEGWSDFCSLFVTATNSTGKKRVIAEYASGTPNGIRAFPYTPDMDLNPATYGTLNLVSDYSGFPGALVHFIGSIFATVLWDLYWAVVEKEEADGWMGFNPDKYQSDEGGSNIAFQLVVEGLKSQPCNPSFVDSRDAILRADENLFDGEYSCTIWKAFARRGLGAEAATSDSPSELAVTESFDLPKHCLGTFVSLHSADFEAMGGDGDPFIDNCENGLLTIGIKNTGVGPVINVRLVELKAISSTSSVTDALPVRLVPSTLEEGEIGEVVVGFISGGLEFESPLMFEATFDGDDLPEPISVVVGTLRTQTDLHRSESLNWDFRDSLNDWAVVQGDFTLSEAGVVLKLAGEFYASAVATFGSQTFNLSGVNVIDSETDGCRRIDDEEYVDSIVIIERGNCTFTDKVFFAQNRGALAVIVTDNESEAELFMMEGDNDEITIPSVSVSLDSGGEILRRVPTTDSELYRSSNTILASSKFKSSRCDRIRSPKIALTVNSTMTIRTNFEIEDTTFDGAWYDRANVGLFDGEERITVDPDGGVKYEAFGPGPVGEGTAPAQCTVVGENGWAASTNGAWKDSEWSTDALNLADLTGQVVQIDLAYGTDQLAAGKGIWVEQVTISNVDVVIPDKKPNVCSGADTRPSVTISPTFTSMTKAPTRFPTLISTTTPTNDPILRPTNGPTSGTIDSPSLVPTNSSTSGPTNSPMSDTTTNPPTILGCLNCVGETKTCLNNPSVQTNGNTDCALCLLSKTQSAWPCNDPGFCYCFDSSLSTIPPTGAPAETRLLLSTPPSIPTLSFPLTRSPANAPTTPFPSVIPSILPSSARVAAPSRQPSSFHKSSDKYKPSTLPSILAKPSEVPTISPDVENSTSPSHFPSSTAAPPTEQGGDVGPNPGNFDTESSSSSRKFLSLTSFVLLALLSLISLTELYVNK